MVQFQFQHGSLMLIEYETDFDSVSKFLYDILDFFFHLAKILVVGSKFKIHVLTYRYQ